MLEKLRDVLDEVVGVGWETKYSWRTSVLRKDSGRPDSVLLGYAVIKGVMGACVFTTGRKVWGFSVASLPNGGVHTATIPVERAKAWIAAHQGSFQADVQKEEELLNGVVVAEFALVQSGAVSTDGSGRRLRYVGAYRVRLKKNAFSLWQGVQYLLEDQFQKSHFMDAFNREGKCDSWSESSVFEKYVKSEEGATRFGSMSQEAVDYFRKVKLLREA